MKRLLAVAAAATVAVGVAGTAAAHGADPAPSAKPAAASGYNPPPITWHKCQAGWNKAGFQCGRLIVPLDYSHPQGRKISLAVSRIKHTVPRSKYQGVMLTNPGGPGGSGLILPILKYYVPNHAGDAYDWIGFDPRGVGSSRPSLTCNQYFFHGDRPQYRPVTGTIMHQWVTRSKRYARQCVDAKHSALFNHVKTVDTVNDMESLRKALHAKKINYYGFSYGTYLGQVYATLHPNRVRRFVLDSNVDPKRVFYKSNQDQDRAFQKTFNIYFHWLARYHRVYHVGATFHNARARWIAARRHLDKHAARGILGGDELIDVFTSAGYYVYGWEDIAKAWSAYENQHNPRPLIRMYKSANPITKGADNGYAMYLGTQCTDAPWPHNQAKTNRDNWRLDKRYSYFTWSNAWFNGPCDYWKFPAGQPVQVSGANVKTPILMIDETYDAATPYPGNLVVRHLFPSASLIEGLDGSTHAGSLSGVACTDDTIARYLTKGTVPRRKAHYGADKICPPVPQPNPTASGAATPNAAAANSVIASLYAKARQEIARDSALIG
ncbi:MAG TPA: alpha/beta hydrolase [Jatrophihabitans sp.]|nr:alpha/beta hydrolase [Jatrophihabitans sp.]